MPKLTNVNNAARNATKTRRVRLPKAKPFTTGLSGASGDGYTVQANGLIIPSRDDIHAFGNVIIVPSQRDIDQFGVAEHAAYVNAHSDEYEPNIGLLAISDAEPLPFIANVQPDAASVNAASPAPVPEYTERQLARRAAAKAVREFYPGPSLPFKAAVDLRYRAAINFARFTPGTITGTERTASALAAILAYCTVNPDGTFVRGSGAVPRTMLGLPADPANPTLAAGIESGVLSRLIGTGAISYVSGATNGTGAELAVLRVNYKATKNNMLAHNEKLAGGEHRYSRVLALLDDTISDHA